MADISREYNPKSKYHTKSKGKFKIRKRGFRSKRNQEQNDVNCNNLTTNKSRFHYKGKPDHDKNRYEERDQNFKVTDNRNVSRRSKERILKGSTPPRHRNSADSPILSDDRTYLACVPHYRYVQEQDSSNKNFRSSKFPLYSPNSRIEFQTDYINNDNADSYKISNSPKIIYDSLPYETKALEERIVECNNEIPSSYGKDDIIENLCQKINNLQEQVEFLAQENDRLNFRSCNVKSNGDTEGDVNVTFRDESLQQQLSPILHELVADLISGNLKVEALQKFLSSNRPSAEDIDNWNALPAEDLFVVDNSTTEPNEGSDAKWYESDFNEILQDKEDTKDESSSQRKPSKVCFNCSESHFINECPHPLNRRKIATARRNHQKPYVSSVRYHAQFRKESDFKPGVISDELRKALGLNSGQLPLYVYHMRILNYPPGWLEEAAVESSGITLYGLNGNAQLEETKQGAKVQYDPDKLVDFPGFNAPLPPDIIDECYQLGFPPMQPHLLRSVVEQTMTKPDVLPKRKKKLEDPTCQPSKIPRLEEDMDLDEDLENGILEFNPPLPSESLPPLPLDEPPELPPPDDFEEKVPSAPASPDSRSNTSNSQSMMETLAPVVERFQLEGSSDVNKLPSLEELEEIKKQLEMELQAGSESEGECSTPLSVDVISESSYGSEQRTETKCHGSKLVSLGTPSLSRHSSFQKLPDYDNFAKDVTSHLNFENLPNSTGTYEKMKKVIKKVKEKINSLIQ